MTRTCFVLLFGLVVSHAAPVVNDPSFEASVSLAYPGYTTVFPFWSRPEGQFNSGVNPYMPAVSEDPTFKGLVNPFADNGKVPHGTNVCFLQGVSSVRQAISGFEPGKVYTVHYFCNRRAGTQPAGVVVRLNGLQLDATGDIPAVENAGRWTAPYYERFSDDFLAEGAGPYTLEFQGSVTEGDGTGLFDNVSIEELSLIEVVAARRLSANRSKIQIKFSIPVDRASAENVANYMVNDQFMVISAERVDDKTVLLMTDTDLVDDQTYQLKLLDVRDSSSKRIQRAHALVPLSTQPLLPVEFGQDVNGFEDNFLGGRDPGWINVGEDVFKFGHGTLVIRGSAASPSYLLYTGASYPESVHEIVARIMVSTPTAPQGAGLVASVSPTTKQGLELPFKTAGEQGTVALQPFGKPGIPLTSNWAVQSWYWVRFRHEPNANGQPPDVTVKIWSADGDTPEPAAGQSLDYGTDPSAYKGLAGFLSGLGTETHMEVDYVLIRGEGLPLITPSLKANPIAISIELKEGFIEVSWPDRAANYFLEFNDVLRSEGWNPVSSFPEDLEGRKVIKELHDPAFNRFYRLRQP